MRLFLILIACVGVSIVAMRGEAQGFCGGLGCSPPVHQEMTAEALSFLKSSVLEDINDEHEFQEVFGFLDSDEHFDNCSFSGAAAEINANYDDALIQADPNNFDSGDLADQFGQLLHGAQDFYSHSNWVDLGQTTLIDRGYGFWNALTPYSLHDGVLLVQGEDETPFGDDSSLSRSGNTVFVNTGSSPPGIPPGTYKGVISGTFGPTDDCPDNVSVSHGDLNKDTPDKTLFPQARELGLKQTKHEWCRLVNLVKQKYGRKGVKVLFENWVVDEDKAISLCPNADIAFVIDTTGSMFDDIAAVKAAVTEIIDSLDKEPVIVRLGLATYKDFPVAPFGSPGDFPFRADSKFSLDDDIKTAINGLSASGGNNIPESVYTGLMETINGSLGTWRNNANAKAIILMGDAPPHDPEPFTGFTANSVIAAANALDPARIFPIFIGFDTSARTAFQKLAEGTGGEVFDAQFASDVVQALLEAIETILTSPVADAAGPYTGTVGKTITFDGSGSFDSDGNIVLYEWDFQSDGVFDFSSTTSPTAKHTFSTEFTGTVTLRVTDNDGQTGIDTAPVEVKAATNQPPTANAGAAQTVDCASPAGGKVSLNGTASSDPDGDQLTFSWSAPGITFNNPASAKPTATFPLGTKTVTLKVTDPGGLSDTDTVAITVQDKTPPTLTGSANPASLWPPDHKYELIALSLLASDICDPSLKLTAVAQSNEPDDANGNGDGNTTGDIKVTKAGGQVLLSSNAAPQVAFDPIKDKLELRAERAGSGQDRTYTITVTATDDSGNQATAKVTVTVAHNQGK